MMWTAVGVFSNYNNLKYCQWERLNDAINRQHAFCHPTVHGLLTPSSDLLQLTFFMTNAVLDSRHRRVLPSPKNIFRTSFLHHVHTKASAVRSTEQIQFIWDQVWGGSCMQVCCKNTGVKEDWLSDQQYRVLSDFGVHFILIWVSL